MEGVFYGKFISTQVETNHKIAVALPKTSSPKIISKILTCTQYAAVLAKKTAPDDFNKG